MSADGRDVYAFVPRSLLRLDARDLHVIGHADSPALVWGNLTGVPGTDHVIGAGVGGRIYRWDMASGDLVASG